MRHLLVACCLAATIACVEIAPDADTLAVPEGADPAADLAPAEGVAPTEGLAAGVDGAHTPDLDPAAAPAVGATLTAVARTGEGQRVVATLPSGRRVLLGSDDVMPGGFRAQSPRYKLTAVYWVGR